jgi:hypothetical protein
MSAPRVLSVAEILKQPRRAPARPLTLAQEVAALFTEARAPRRPIITRAPWPWRPPAEGAR